MFTCSLKDTCTDAPWLSDQTSDQPLSGYCDSSVHHKPNTNSNSFAQYNSLILHYFLRLGRDRRSVWMISDGRREVWASTGTLTQSDSADAAPSGYIENTDSSFLTLSGPQIKNINCTEKKRSPPPVNRPHLPINNPVPTKWNQSYSVNRGHFLC